MKLNYKKTVLVGFAFFLICAFWQAYDNLVPMMLVNKFGLNQTLSGIIMSLDNIIALFMLPLFGALSDKTVTKWGRRTPYIVVGTIVAAVCFFGLTFADNAQRARVEGDGSGTFYAELFEENAEITNAEYNNLYNSGVAKQYKVKDYASLINYNEEYDLLSEDQKEVVKNWFTSIDADYFADKTKPETEYFYDAETDLYRPLSVDAEGNRYYEENGNKVLVDKSSARNAYTNLITPSRSSYAWKKTVENPLPLVFFGILLLLTLIAMSVFRSPAVALMPDVTVKPLRSQANAVINLMGTAGGMIVLVMGILFGTGKTYNQMMSYTGFIGAVSALMVVALLVFIWKVREPLWCEQMQQEAHSAGLDDKEEEKGGEKKLSSSERVSLVLILASVALWYIAYNAVTSKYSLYATNVLHKDYNTTLLIAQGAAIVSYLPVGALARKIGRKKSILIGVVMLTVAFAGAIFMNENTPTAVLNVLFALAGIGWATINVNSFPMVVELASGSNVGKYTGYYYTASMAAQIVTPILSGAVMDMIGNMRPLFYYATVFAALAFVTMIFVRHGDSKPEKKSSVLENLDVGD